MSVIDDSMDRLADLQRRSAVPDPLTRAPIVRTFMSPTKPEQKDAIVNKFTELFQADHTAQVNTAVAVVDAQVSLTAAALAAGANPATFTDDAANLAVLAVDRAVHLVALVLTEVARRYPKAFVAAAAMGFMQTRALFDSLEGAVRAGVGVDPDAPNEEVVAALELTGSAAAAQWILQSDAIGTEQVQRLVAAAVEHEAEPGRAAAVAG